MSATFCGLPGLAAAINFIVLTNKSKVKGLVGGLQPSSTGRRSFSIAGGQLINRINQSRLDSLLLTEKVLDKTAVDRVGRLVPNHDLVPKREEVSGRLSKSSSRHKGLVKGWVRGTGCCYAGRANIGCHLDVDGFTSPVGPGLVEDCLVEGVVISKVVVPTTEK